MRPEALEIVLGRVALLLLHPHVPEQLRRLDVVDVAVVQPLVRLPLAHRERVHVGLGEEDAVVELLMAEGHDLLLGEAV